MYYLYNVYLYLYKFVSLWVGVYTYVFVVVCFLWLIHSNIFVFFPRLRFSLIFILTWGTTMKLRLFCPFCTIPAILDTIHICLQQYLNFNFYILTFNQFVCLFFFLLRLIFDIINLQFYYRIFQVLYSFLWFVFMAKWNLLT